MVPGREKCSKCESWRSKNVKRGKVKHTCAHNTGRQRCQRNGQLLVCGRNPRNAEGCDYFKAKALKPVPVGCQDAVAKGVRA
jgi:hypothetical protein